MDQLDRVRRWKPKSQLESLVFWGVGLPVLGSIFVLLMGGSPPDVGTIVSFALVGLVSGYLQWRRQTPRPD